MKRIFSFILSVILFFGCYEDKGNYAYRELQEVIIELPADNYSIQFGDALQITPTITTSIPEEDLRYYWEFCVDTINTWYDQYVAVQEGYELDYVCEQNEKMFPIEGTYNLRLRVNQVSTDRQFYSNDILVTMRAGESKTGLMVLHGNGNLTDVGIIVADEFQWSAPETPMEIEIIPNFYSEINGGEKLAGIGKQIIQTYCANALDVSDAVWNIALTDQASMYADGRTMVRYGEWGDMFIGSLNQGDAQAAVIYDYDFYVFDGGDIFRKQLYAVAFTTPSFVARDYTYDFYPNIWCPTTNFISGLLFDRNSKGFIWTSDKMNFYNLYPLDATGEESVSSLPFNPSDMQADLVHMDFGGGPGHMLAVMYSNTGEYFLIEMDMNAVNNADIPLYRYDLTHLADVQQGEVIDWAFTSNSINACYYATKNGVYNFAATAGLPVNPESLKMQDNSLVEMEGEVTCMKLLKSNMPSWTSSHYYMANEILVVATYDGTPGSGRIYSMQIDINSGRVISVKEYVGFDLITDVDLKFL